MRAVNRNRFNWWEKHGAERVEKKKRAAIKGIGCWMHPEEISLRVLDMQQCKWYMLSEMM